MSRAQGLRRAIAIHWRLVVTVVGCASIVYSPFAAVTDSVAVGGLMLVAGIIAIGLSVTLARTLDLQRRIRSLVVPAPAAAAVPAVTAVPAAEKKAAPVVTRPTGADVTPGCLLAGHGVAELPVIAFDATGLAGGELRSAVNDVAGHQLISGWFKPIFIVDHADFGPVRAHGYVAELLIAPEDWSGDPAGRAEYVRRRLESIRRAYGCVGLLRAGADGLGEIGRLTVEELAGNWARTHQVTLPENPPPRPSRADGRRPVITVKGTS